MSVATSYNHFNYPYSVNPPSDIDPFEDTSNTSENTTDLIRQAIPGFQSGISNLDLRPTSAYTAVTSSQARPIQKPSRSLNGNDQSDGLTVAQALLNNGKAQGIFPGFPAAPTSSTTTTTTTTSSTGTRTGSDTSLGSFRMVSRGRPQDLNPVSRRTMDVLPRHASSAYLLGHGDDDRRSIAGLTNALSELPPDYQQATEPLPGQLDHR